MHFCFPVTIEQRKEITPEIREKVKRSVDDKIMEKSNREKAIAWWNTIESENKNAYVTIVLMQPERSYKTLTGREIEIIYKQR